MAVKTGPNNSAHDRGQIADLFASALILMRNNKRSEAQQAALRNALQLFLENRLGMVLAGNVDKAPADLHFVLSLSLTDVLERKLATWCKNFGAKYVGELYALPENHQWRTSKRREAEGVRLALGALGMPPVIDIAASGWIPPYATDSTVLATWQMRLHVLGNFQHFMMRRDPERRICEAHAGCITVGEYLRNPPYSSSFELKRWRLQTVINELARHGLHLCMYVPASWTPVARDPEGCATFQRYAWEGQWLDPNYEGLLASYGNPTLESFTQITEKVCRERYRDNFTGMIEEMLRARGQAFAPELPATEQPPISIEDCEFSIRTANCLRDAGLLTLQLVALKTEDEMLRVPNFGRKCLNELREVMTSYGLSFAKK